MLFSRAMLVKILQGIPFLVEPSTQSIFAYEKPLVGTPLRLGTYDMGQETFTLVDNWKELYQSKVDTYRASEKPRSRISAQQQTR
jgi:hypothetical protein